MGIKIGRNSRYYSASLELVSFLSAASLFPKDYNEDKKCYFTVYNDETQPKLSGIQVTNNIINNVKTYFDSNLYEQQEIKLLLENLIPYAETFGKGSIETMGRTCIMHEKFPLIEKIGVKKWGDFTEEVMLRHITELYPLHIQEKIKVLLEIRELLTNSLITYYENIISNNKGKETNIITYNNTTHVVNSPNVNIIAQSEDVSITQSSNDIYSIIETIRKEVIKDGSIEKSRADEILECLNEIQQSVKSNVRPKFAVKSLLSMSGDISSVASFVIELCKLVGWFSN